ncbi:MAG TPA: DinB family protein [Bryobacteraceae bacterium]|jgi:uncharacterized damage-inducible protein DinB|nr:DinB family protein [Bryobacteraceae bacterium]
MEATVAAETTAIVTPQTLLEHWQGHRRLTRRVIEAFPEDKLFTFSLGGMRPFSEFVIEFLKMAEPIVHGVATGEWNSLEMPEAPKSKAELLRLWDEATAAINKIWPTIPQSRFRLVEKAFGMWENENVATILYAIDNETHHRGQGYVYLRALGIEPPPFWERG